LYVHFKWTQIEGNKVMGKTTRKVKLRDDTARIVADIHGVSTSLVQKVRSGERENDEIMNTLVEYQTGKTALIKHLEALIPVTSKPMRS
jgi:hypothetical protein